MIVNAPLPDDVGVDFAVELCAESDAGVLLLIAFYLPMRRIVARFGKRSVQAAARSM